MSARRSSLSTMALLAPNRRRPAGVARKPKCRIWLATVPALGRPSGAHGGPAAMGRWRPMIRLPTPSPCMPRCRDVPMIGNHCRPNPIRQPVPRFRAQVKRHPRRHHLAVRCLPSRRYANWPRIWALILPLAGSGPGGVITRDDVMQASARTRAEPVEAPEVIPRESVEAAPQMRGRAAREDVRVPVKGVRKSTADAMVRSAFTAPHVSVWMDCNVTATMELVERLKSRREIADLRVSPLLIIAKAVCLALGRTPELNSFWDEPAQHIVLKSSINLGIATATPRGLLVPNIKGAESLGLADLAAAIKGIVATARDGRTQPADLAGGTFTITNIGVFGVDAGSPILNPGESGILCFGQIARRPWVVGMGSDERIEPRWVITLSLSFDHRLADGAQGSTFLADVAAILNDPALALLF